LVYTLSVSRLLINPDIQAAEDFEGWYIQHETLILVFILYTSYIHLSSHMLLCVCALGTLILQV